MSKQTLLLVAGVIATLWSVSARAADAYFCDDYARDAVHQSKLFFESHACQEMDRGNPDAGMWSTNRDHHYSWCLRVSMSEADAGRDKRAGLIHSCR